MVDIQAEHLLPEIRPLLQLTDSERIMHIEKDNWIGYSRARQVLNKLQALYSHPQRQRMPNLLIIGPTNNGKSMIIEKFCRDYPPIKEKFKPTYNYRIEERDVLVELPILSVQMLPAPDIRRFYRTIFDKIRAGGGFETMLLHASPLEDNVIKVLTHFKVKMLIIDEIHNVLAGRNDKQHEFLNALRYLGNALKIPIVCVGTKDAYLAIRSDAQLENRFEPFLLSAWKASQEYESLLASLMAILPLKFPSNLNHPPLSRYILEKSDGILGEIFTLVRRAAVMAIHSGREMIDENLLKEIDYHSPTERIRLFERHIAGAA
ncbi:MAG: TniB family NTP-binding protein [Gammaproteobacteria bacterium]